MQTYYIKIDSTGREIGQHGTENFPVAVYTTQIRKNLLGFIDWHWHQELQICLVTEGCVVFHVEADEIVLHKGDGIFISAGLFHQAKNFEGTDSSYICIDYHPKLMQHIGDSILDQKYIDPYVRGEYVGYLPLHQNIPWQTEVLGHVKSIRNQFERSELPYFSIYLEILHLWYLLYENHLSLIPLNKRPVRYQTAYMIARYVNTHYSEPIRLEELAKVAGLTESTCCRIFKNSMGCTIFEYINNIRLLQSEHLLLETSLPVTEIALQCGFGSASYYNRNFKKKIGICPSAYRKRHLASKRHLT